MSKQQLREKAVRLFRENKGAYHISLTLDIPIKEVYHYLMQDEELRNIHKRTVAERVASES